MSQSQPPSSSPVEDSSNTIINQPPEETRQQWCLVAPGSRAELLLSLLQSNNNNNSDDRTNSAAYHHHHHHHHRVEDQSHTTTENVFDDDGDDASLIHYTRLGIEPAAQFVHRHCHTTTISSSSSSCPFTSSRGTTRLSHMLLHFFCYLTSHTAPFLPRHLVLSLEPTADRELPLMQRGDVGTLMARRALFCSVVSAAAHVLGEQQMCRRAMQTAVQIALEPQQYMQRTTTCITIASCWLCLADVAMEVGNWEGWEDHETTASRLGDTHSDSQQTRQPSSPSPSSSSSSAAAALVDDNNGDSQPRAPRVSRKRKRRDTENHDDSDNNDCGDTDHCDDMKSSDQVQVDEHSGGLNRSAQFLANVRLFIECQQRRGMSDLTPEERERFPLLQASLDWTQFRRTLLDDSLYRRSTLRHKVTKALQLSQQLPYIYTKNYISGLQTLRDLLNFQRHQKQTGIMQDHIQGLEEVLATLDGLITYCRQLRDFGAFAVMLFLLGFKHDAIEETETEIQKLENNSKDKDDDDDEQNEEEEEEHQTLSSPAFLTVLFKHRRRVCVELLTHLGQHCHLLPLMGNFVDRFLSIAGRFFLYRLKQDGATPRLLQYLRLSKQCLLASKANYGFFTHMTRCLLQDLDTGIQDAQEQHRKEDMSAEGGKQEKVQNDDVVQTGSHPRGFEWKCPTSAEECPR